jgi:hypothetical protein
MDKERIKLAKKVIKEKDHPTLLDLRYLADMGIPALFIMLQSVCVDTFLENLDKWLKENGK